ncbi:Signal peptidase complex subunit 2 [Homalodisca vitripennis]|nr:Signal peptidase complex subunit 2 [Homalodisca vitripennis]
MTISAEENLIFARYDDKYNLVLSCRDSKTGAVRESQFLKSVACFIDENGVIVYDLIEPEVSKLHNSISQDRKDK